MERWFQRRFWPSWALLVHLLAVLAAGAAVHAGLVDLMIWLPRVSGVGGVLVLWAQIASGHAVTRRIFGDTTARAEHPVLFWIQAISVSAVLALPALYWLWK